MSTADSLISIVIPTLNEAEALPTLLTGLKGEVTPHEIIVADGESTDDTRMVALRHGARLAATARGRGAQLAAGAAAARGDVILFLHADSCFPRGGLTCIRSIADTRADVIGGNFRLAFHEPDRFAQWVCTEASGGDLIKVSNKLPGATVSCPRLCL